MKLSIVFLRYLFVISIFLYGCATTDSAKLSINAVIDDQTLEHNINNVLSTQIPDGSFTVASLDQKVLLAGQVPNKDDRYKAELAVTNISGVKKVWNYITISNAETVVDITHDAYLTSAAKSRLIAQKGINANNIKVITTGSIVFLLGSQSGDPVQLAGAIDGIKNISGVVRVVNLIQN